MCLILIQSLVIKKALTTMLLHLDKTSRITGVNIEATLKNALKQQIVGDLGASKLNVLS